MKNFIFIVFMFLIGTAFGIFLVAYHITDSSKYVFSQYAEKYVWWNNFTEVTTHATTQATTLQTTQSIFNSSTSLTVNKDANLYERVRILCWVMTSPKNLYKKAVHVNATWGRHCNKLLFMSSVADEKFPAIGLDVKEGRKNLYNKTKEAFRYIWLNHRDEADWFLKADDDTYVILENLRYLLKDYDPIDPLYFGRKFNRYLKEGFMSGGAGYVLSKDALARYYIATTMNGTCIQGSNYEDVEIGRCLTNIGVKAMDSRDQLQLERFLPVSPLNILKIKTDPNFWASDYSYYPHPKGFSCCSNYIISFHYVNPDMMHMLEFFVYRLRVFGKFEHQIANMITNNSTEFAQYQSIDT